MKEGTKVRIGATIMCVGLFTMLAAAFTKTKVDNIASFVILASGLMIVYLVDTEKWIREWKENGKNERICPTDERGAGDA